MPDTELQDLVFSLMDFCVALLYSFLTISPSLHFKMGTYILYFLGEDVILFEISVYFSYCSGGLSEGLALV